MNTPISSRNMFLAEHARSRWGIHSEQAPAVLILLVVATMLLPNEASFFVGTLRMTAARVLLLILAPLCLIRFTQRTSLLSYQFVWSDFFVPLTGLWMLLAVWISEGANRAIVGSGVTTLEFVGPYFAARTLLVRHGQALALAHLMSLVIGAVGMIALLDTFCGYYVTHYLISKITGVSFIYLYDIRYGHLRAAATLEHPILLGTACATGMLLGLTLSATKRAFALCGAGIGLLVSISSAPIMGAFVTFGCLVYRRLTPGFDARWRCAIILWSLATALLLAVHPAPFGWLTSHLTFDSMSGYYRLLIWQIAGKVVLDSPIFGIGLTDDWARPNWMPPSVDSLWLRSAMSFGIPGALLIAACIIGSCSRKLDTPTAALSEDERRLGVALSLVQFLYILLGFTVHFWGVTWILMGFCAGIRSHLGGLANPACPQSPSPLSA